MVTQTQIATHRHEIDLPLSEQREFGIATSWLAFYALAAVIVVIANFGKAVDAAVALL